MSDKLGFTFYPKDWWTSESFFELNPHQRYIYLESLFIMYSNDGLMKTQKTQFENRTRIEISAEDWKIVTDKFILENGNFTHPSVNKRLRKTLANRENGKKGGRPEKPKEPKKETQNNPPLESEREYKENISELDNNDPLVIKHNSYSKQCLEQPTWIETIEMQKVVLKGKTEIALKNFNLHLISQSENKTTLKDYKSHFVNWMNKRNQQKAVEANNDPKKLLL